MKYILPLLLLVCLSGRAQKRTYQASEFPFRIDSISGNISYLCVEQLPDVPADQLYSRAKAFIFKAFNNADRVIQVDDKSGGLLGAKGLLITRGIDRINVPLELRFKDGRYRYEIANMELIAGGVRMNLDYAKQKTMPALNKPMSEKQYQFWIDSMLPVTKFVDQLKAAMKQSVNKEDF